MFAAIFDMNGVIVDDMAFHFEAWRDFFRQHGVELTDHEFHTQMAGRNNTETIRCILNSGLSKEECARFEQEKEKLYRANFKPHLSLLAGLGDLLQELSAKDVPAAVATSAPTENVTFVLDGLDIRQFFKAVVDAGQVERGKPHPDLFLAAAAALGVPPGRCIVFEDSVHGIEAARRAGMKAVGVTTTLEPAVFSAADCVIPDFNGIRVEALQELLDGIRG